MSFDVSKRRWRALGLPRLVVLALIAARMADAQRPTYPVSPLPVLDVSALRATPRLTGYVAVRDSWGRDSSTFTIQRAVLSLVLHPASALAVRFATDFSRSGRPESDGSIGTFLLTDAYIQVVPTDTASFASRRRAGLIVGQFKTPFSLEYLTSFGAVRTANRSLPVDVLSTRRDIGVLGSMLMMPSLRITVAAVNGRGTNVDDNPDGSVLAIGRVTLLPRVDLAISGKLGGERGDRLWGADARWLPGAAILEAEVIDRSRPAAISTDSRGAAIDGSGGYGLVAYRMAPWLQPTVKWERLRLRTAGKRRIDRTTYGLNVLSSEDHLRLIINAVLASGAASLAPARELVVQLNAVF